MVSRPGNGRPPALLWAIAALALAVRLGVALDTAYLWDEDREWIRLARTIVLDPSAASLPLQGFTHPVLPAYFMKLGTLALGDGPAGFRLLSVLAGSATVLLVGRLAWRRAGPAAGTAAALLLALDEYHVAVSSVAVDMVFYLLFLALAAGSFSRFLERPAASALVVTGLLTGLAYMCNERAGMLVPIWGLGLLVAGHRAWLARPAAWGAVAAFLVVVSPDLLKGWLGEASGTQTSFSEHLTRVAGLGLTYQPAAFFGKDLTGLLLGLAGRRFMDWAPEYPAMNEAFGAALLLGSAACLLSRVLRERPEVRAALAWVLVSLAALVLLRTELNEDRGLGPQAWYWADLALLPAVLLCATAIGVLAGWRRHGLVVLLAAGCLVSAYRIAVERLDMPWVKAAASPAVLHPPDGRMVEVRTQLQACARCDAAPVVALEAVEAEVSGRLRPALPGEAARDASGDPGRIALRALPGVSLYALRYRVREAGGREASLAIDVVVRSEPPRWPPPFWVKAPPAPSPPTAGGS
jgi:hypothetical protein